MHNIYETNLDFMNLLLHTTIQYELSFFNRLGRSTRKSAYLMVSLYVNNKLGSICLLK